MATTGILAVIPARGGSRRIPGKNIRPLGGQPIIAYTIEAALQSGLFSQVIVSTDSPDIAQISRSHGAEVPFLRKAQLADDHTPVSAATVDVLQRLDPDQQRFDRVCQLMPNCPFRTADGIVASYCQFSDSGAHSQISVVRYSWQNPWWALRLGKDNTVEPLFPDQMTSRSQDLPALYCPSGAVWWARTDTLLHSRTFHIAGRTGWELPWQQGLDIDTEDDWALAEALLRMQTQEEELQ